MASTPIIIRTWIALYTIGISIVYLTDSPAYACTCKPDKDHSDNKTSTDAMGQCSPITGCQNDTDYIEMCSAYRECCKPGKESQDDCITIKSYVKCAVVCVSNGKGTRNDYDNDRKNDKEATVKPYDDDDDDDEDDDKDNQNYRLDPGTAIGIGVGVGAGGVMILVCNVCLLIYCRYKGRKEGRNKERQSSSSNTRFCQSDYTEIEMVQGNASTVAETANPTYSIAPQSTNSPHLNGQAHNVGDPGPASPKLPPPNKQPHVAADKKKYMSLTKPADEMENPEYTDPEKYTTPPNHIDDTRKQNQYDEESEDDYVKQDTPTHVYTQLKKSTSSTDKNIPQVSTSLAGDYVDVDHPNCKDDPKTVLPDYINVEGSSCEDDPKPVESDIASTDYVDVDDPAYRCESHSITREVMVTVSNNYVDVDDTTAK